MTKHFLNSGIMTLLLLSLSACNKNDGFAEIQKVNVTKNEILDRVEIGDGGEPNLEVDALEIIDTFSQSSEKSKKLDIVWIIDNSGSMKDEQTALGTNFSAFIDDFLMRDVDFKMAITTTDTSSADKKGKIVNESDVKLTSIKAKEDPSLFKDNFRSLVNVGISGSGTERGLEASEGFMDKHGERFLRPDAYLAVVIVSDEEDSSSKSVEYYSDHLKKFKSSKGLVKVYSIVDVNATKAANRGGKYMEASKLTSGMIGNIKDDFHHVLTDLGESIINLLDSFALTHIPAGSLKVYVNGELSHNYTYDASSNSIKFPENALPPVGAEIKIKYSKK